MIKHAFSDFSYAINNESAKKGHKEILVCFIYNGVEVLKKVYIPEGDGIAYIFEAKKVIDKEMRNGSLTIYSRKFITKKKKEEAKKKKSAPKKQEEIKVETPIVPTRNGVSGKVVVAICVVAALAIVGAGLLGHFLTRPPEPTPTTKEVGVNVDFSKVGGARSESVMYHEIAPAEYGKDYKAELWLDDSLKATNQIDLSISMDGELLTITKDYTFEAKLDNPDVYALTIKNVTGKIVIVPLVKNNTYFVNFTHWGEVTTSNAEGTGEAPDTVAKNGIYTCRIIVSDAKLYEPFIYGITMNGTQLTTDEYELSPVDEKTKLLKIKKNADGNIQIVAQAKPKNPTTQPIFFTSYGCTVPSGVKEINIATGASYSIKTDSEHTTDYLPHVMVDVDNQRLTPGNNTYTFDSSTGNLVIQPNAAKGIVHVTAIAIENASLAHVKFDCVDCTPTGSSEATVGEPYNCAITTTQADYVINIVIVVMNGEPYNNYTFTGGNFSIPEVTGDIYVAVMAKKPEAKYHMVSVIYDNKEVTADYQPKAEDKQTNYGCEIKAVDEGKNWARIVSITMGGIVLSVQSNEYSYDRSTGALTINKEITGDIIIAAIAQAKDKTTFDVDQYVWDCDFTGDEKFTPGQEKDYTAQIEANDTENKQPEILLIKVGGNVLTKAEDYTFVKKADSDTVWVLTIPYQKVDSDVIIAVGVISRTRSSFHVTTYSYNCNTDDTTGTVVRDTQYQSRITSTDSDYEPNVFKVIMGSSVLTKDIDYKLDLSIEQGSNFTIFVGATDDITICVTSRSKTQHVGTPEFTPIDGSHAKITGITPADGDSISDITDVTIPSSVVSESNGTSLEVTQIAVEDKKGVLYGCSKLERLTIPFVGINKNYTEAEPYEGLFGNLFGERMFDGCTSFTWQEFYMDQEKTVYKALKAAIPDSLSVVRIGDGEGSGSVIPKGAFCGCRNIDKIVVNDYDTETIGAYAFAGCSSLKKVDIPEPSSRGAKQKFKNIEWAAFGNCYTLSTFDLTGIEHVGAKAFYGCVSMSSIAVDSSVDTIDSGAFSNIGNAIVQTPLVRSEVENKISTNKWASDWAEEGVSIVYGAYDNDTFIDKTTELYRFARVKIDDGASSPNYGAAIIEYLGDDKGDEAKSVTLPASLKGPKISGTGDSEYPVINIASRVFQGYTKLETLNFSNATYLESIDYQAFSDCISLNTVTGLGDCESFVYLGEEAFSGCPLDTGILLPDSLASIGRGAFANCYRKIEEGGVVVEEYGIESIDIGDVAATALPNDLFSNSFLLKTVTLSSDKITSFGTGIFAGCKSLESLSITPGEGADTIPDSLCEGCSSLTSFTWYSETQNLVHIGSRAFKDCTKLDTVKIQKSTNNKIPTSLMSIADEVFMNCTSMPSFSFGSPSTAQVSGFTIGINVFKGWLNTQSLYIDVDETTEGGWATKHDSGTGNVELSFDWTCTWISGYLQYSTYHSSSSGSMDVIIRRA